MRSSKTHRVAVYAPKYATAVEWTEKNSLRHHHEQNNGMWPKYVVSKITRKLLLYAVNDETYDKTVRHNECLALWCWFCNIRPYLWGLANFLVYFRVYTLRLTVRGGVTLDLSCPLLFPTTFYFQPLPLFRRFPGTAVVTAQWKWSGLILNWTDEWIAVFIS